jgi:hypothetical protein
VLEKNQEGDRLPAIYALNGIGARGIDISVALPVLQQIAENDSNEGVRRQAMGTIKSLQSRSK